MLEKLNLGLGVLLGTHPNATMDTSFALTAMDSNSDSIAVADYAPFFATTAFTLMALAVSCATLEDDKDDCVLQEEEEDEITETSIVPYVPKMTLESLDAAILTLLNSSRKGIPAKDLLRSLRKSDPNLVKKNINSRLYTMLHKKKVQKSDDRTPLWSLA